MSHDHEQEHEHEIISYGTYFITWFALIVLTGLTVTAAGMGFGVWSVTVALAIAGVKASVVLYVFMHLKYEDKVFHHILQITFVTLVIFIGLTFVDTAFR